MGADEEQVFAMLPKLKGDSHDVLVRLLVSRGAGARALLNLVSNAVKFSSDGGEVTIRLTHDEDGCAVIEVVDRGIGVPEAEIPKLATRFFRASNAVDAEITGTGLGLRIAQTIADNHGGRLEMESREGHGTTARLVLPLDEGNKPTTWVLAHI
jgi:two-component system, OmpR family, sensor kinase